MTMDNNSYFHARIKSKNNMRWRRELRTRYPRNYRTMGEFTVYPFYLVFMETVEFANLIQF